MDKDVDLFSEYIKDNTIKGRVRDPRSWVNLLILLIIIAMTVILVQSIRNSWSKEEIKKSIKIIDYNSRWVIKNTGFIGNKTSNLIMKKETSIVPKITFRIKNIGKRELQHIRFIANFVFAEKRSASIGDGYFDVLRNESLKPGEVSEIISIRSTYGYKTTSSSNENFKEMFFKKKGWKKLSVRISARVNSTMKAIVEYPIYNKFDDNAKKIFDNKNNKNNINNDIIKNFKIKILKSEWKHIKKSKDNLFVPTVVFKLENKGRNKYNNLIIRTSFEFDDKKGVIAQWKGKKTIKVDALSANKISDKLYFEAENGVKTTSVKQLFLNKSEWENTMIKIYISVNQSKPFLFKTETMSQKVKGYKLKTRLVR
jgi:hypothetical protein